MARIWLSDWLCLIVAFPFSKTPCHGCSTPSPVPASTSTLPNSKTRGITVRVLLFVLLSISPALAQPAKHTAPDAAANLPSQPVGPNDLIAVSVYDAPELSRTIRVGADGYFRLPMLKQRVKAEGLYPAEVENAIAAALREEQILVDPFVTVTIAEYHSRPISVAGAVKMPLVFQAESSITLLEAVARAQGLRE